MRERAAAVTLREWITAIAEALEDTERLVQTLRRLAETLEGDRVEPRGKHPSNPQLLDDPELLDWAV